MSHVATDARSSALWIPAWDSAAWAMAIPVAGWLRYEGDLAGAALGPILELAVIAAALQAGTGYLISRYRGQLVVGAVDDVLRAIGVTTILGGLLFTIGLTGLSGAPRSLPLIAMFVALPMILGARLVLRLAHERRARPDAASAERVIVFGAGWGGRQIVRSMLGDAESGYLPVALLDDDPALRSHRISGIPVRGSRADVAEVARITSADILVVAIRDVDLDVMQEISFAATQAGLRVKVIPALMDLFRPWVGFSDLRDIDVADLLGRRPVDIDVASIAGYLRGKVVLVTGAGGSIGSELSRQIDRYGPAELLTLDRDESALHALQLSLHGQALLDTPDVILADIRDTETIRQIFRERRPDVVFHAAALKHLPMLQQYPHEAWQTNVLGTANVLDAAVEAEVETFVNISTDKAANPTSILGSSKRIGERLVAHVGARASGTYLSVRFGNVIGSRGSVLATFADQIASDGPVTVTHPDITRFFMTIPEAVRLVVQAGAIGSSGEALVLDMGDPVRIVDVARRLMSMAGRPVQILYTGLRDGEKLHEELLGDGERDYRPVHPSVSHVTVPPLDPALLPSTIPAGAAAEVMDRLVGSGRPDAALHNATIATVLPIGTRSSRSARQPAGELR